MGLLTSINKTTRDNRMVSSNKNISDSTLIISQNLITMAQNLESQNKIIIGQLDNIFIRRNHSIISSSLIYTS